MIFWPSNGDENSIVHISMVQFFILKKNLEIELFFTFVD
jgi:hypothetical protein